MNCNFGSIMPLLLILFLLGMFNNNSNACDNGFGGNCCC